MQIIHQFAVQNMLPEKYLLRELKDADLEDFEIHMFECAVCFEQVQAGQTFVENLKLVFAQRKHRKKQK